MFEPYANLGFCYLAKKKYETAIDFFEKAIDIDDSNAQIYDGLAHSYYELNNTNKAMENWKKAHELDPSLYSPTVKLEIFHE